MNVMTSVDDDDDDADSSSASSAGTSLSISSANSTATMVERVSKTVSDRLLHKYMDDHIHDYYRSELDIDESVCSYYSSSSLWSPAVPRRVFLDSFTGNICSDRDMLSKLRKLNAKAAARCSYFRTVILCFKVL